MIPIILGDSKVNTDDPQVTGVGIDSPLYSFNLPTSALQLAHRLEILQA